MPRLWYDAKRSHISWLGRYVVSWVLCGSAMGGRTGTGFRKWLWLCLRCNGKVQERLRQRHKRCSGKQAGKECKWQSSSKNISEENDEVTSEDGTITRLVDEGRSIARGEKQHLKEVCKQISKVHQRQKRTKIQETIHRIFEEFRSIKKHILHRISEEKNANSKSYKWKKVTQLHREKELQMSSANSAVIYLQTMELKESHTTLLNHEIFTEDTEKKNDEKKLKTYLWLLMKRFRQPWTNSNKERRDNNGIRAEDIKTCDDATKAKIKPSSTRCYLKQSRNVADSTIKRYLQKGNEEYVGS